MENVGNLFKKAHNEHHQDPPQPSNIRPFQHTLYVDGILNPSDDGSTEGMLMGGETAHHQR